MLEYCERNAKTGVNVSDGGRYEPRDEKSFGCNLMQTGKLY
jgi:hypothetical protein